MAKKIEDVVCAGAEDMKIDGVLVNGLEVNQDEEYAADKWEFDELSGRWLDGDKVTEVRSEEISYTEKELDMLVPATWEECVEETGRPPISTKWVDVNKGTVQNQIIRSRLVARDFRVQGESDTSDLFAAMPPLEAKRMLFRMAVRRCREKPCERYKIMLIECEESTPERGSGRGREGLRVAAVGSWGRRGSFEAVALWHASSGQGVGGALCDLAHE